VETGWRSCARLLYKFDVYAMGHSHELVEMVCTRSFVSDAVERSWTGPVPPSEYGHSMGRDAVEHDVPTTAVRRTAWAASGQPLALGPFPPALMGIAGCVPFGTLLVGTISLIVLQFEVQHLSQCQQCQQPSELGCQLWGLHEPGSAQCAAAGHPSDHSTISPRRDWSGRGLAQCLQQVLRATLAPHTTGPRMAVFDVQCAGCPPSSLAKVSAVVAASPAALGHVSTSPSLRRAQLRHLTWWPWWPLLQSR